MSRKAQRKRRRGDADVARANYVTAKKALTKAIKISKRQGWATFLEAVDRDVWSRGYNNVYHCLGYRMSVPLRDRVSMKAIVDDLFPDHPVRVCAPLLVIEADVQLFTNDELHIAVYYLSNRKAPGPDGIPVEILKIVASEYPSVLLNMYNVCLVAGIFTKRWEMQRLVLLDKCKGPLITPSSFGQLCMLDNAGKIFEKLLRTRLRNAIEESGGLSENQHGFRINHSIIGAIKELITMTQRVWQGNHRTRSCCVLITLDVKNALNSARWVDILDALKHGFGVPAYLRSVISDNLDDRMLLYETTEGQQSRKVTAGVAQASALGPDLWNVVYNDVLKIVLPKRVKLIGFADDLGTMILARTVSKTEVVVLTIQRHYRDLARFEIAGETIVAVPAAQYLGVYVYKKLTHWSHIQKAADKASVMVAKLSRLMPNIKGPRESKKKNSHECSSFNNVVWFGDFGGCPEAPAAMVVAGVIPIFLLAMKRKRVYDRSQREQDRQSIRAQERARTIVEWQLCWSTETRGRWTQRLIREVASWKEIEFCDYCPTKIANVEHTFYECDRWAHKKHDLETVFGHVFTPENTINTMLRNQEDWESVTSYVEIRNFQAGSKTGEPQNRQLSILLRTTRALEGVSTKCKNKEVNREVQSGEQDLADVRLIGLIPMLLKGVRETRKGEILIEVGPSADGRSKLSLAIKEVVGTVSSVRELVPRS
ncbi:uncharacterized protein LOC117180665 [Belonocnema kinseyi]|uniref:uncharacterized protein LOC117180665 n=1 Tax=Belonocnema kinseyi TaxID=2817044 RepID=UPI00143CD2B4|nr:uncharacterized protein LOC117180665 [Belonocnema kinseyi]